MRTPTEKDDALLRQPAQARSAVAGALRVLTVALVIAPLMTLLVTAASPVATHAHALGGDGGGGGGGGGQGSFTVTPDNGPAGTHVMISGSGFPANSDVTVGYGSNGCTSGVTTIAGATGKTDGGGKLKVSFGWPSTPAGKYTVCVTVSGTTTPSDNQFTATTPNAPAITVTTPVAAGGQVTVTGTNFLMNSAQTVQVTYGAQGSNGCTTSAGTAPITNGGFSLTFNAPFVNQTTQYTVTAVTPEASCAGTPILSAQATLTVNGSVTPTATNTPQPSPTATTPGGPEGIITWPPTWPPNGPWTVVYCLIGLLLLLLLLLLALLFARNRRRDEPVTIQERDNVTVQSQGQAGQAGGAGTVQRNIEAVDPRTGRRTVIAQDEYTFEEVPDDQQPQP
jgi:hypothetical protein